jgi:hypothetical protein
MILPLGDEPSLLRRFTLIGGLRPRLPHEGEHETDLRERRVAWQTVTEEGHAAAGGGASERLRAARVQDGVPLAPGLSTQGGQVSAADLAAARSDLSRLDIGWALLWPTASPAVAGYLTATGFRLDYRGDGVTVYRLAR